METIRTEIESESETEDELWDSPNSTTNLSMTETIHDFDKLEMKREKIEIELGIQYVLNQLGTFKKTTLNAYYHNMQYIIYFLQKTFSALGSFR